jgi:hypothetical protein
VRPGQGALKHLGTLNLSLVSRHPADPHQRQHISVAHGPGPRALPMCSMRCCSLYMEKVSQGQCQAMRKD